MSRCADRPPRGRVLRVKQGYNPNSSSVGSEVPTYLALALGSGAFTVLALNALDAVGRLIRKRRDALAPQGKDDKG